MPTNRKAVIALSGKRFSGKDALASALMIQAKNLGFSLQRRALADDCKQAFAASMASQGVRVDATRLIADRAYKEAWRPELTRFTETQLAADPQVFCRRILAESHDEIVLISDVRLHAEIAYLRASADVFLVRITRSDASRRASGWVTTDGVDDHRTETELDAFDDWNLRVRNDGTFDDLSTIASEVWSSFKTRA